MDKITDASEFLKSCPTSVRYIEEQLSKAVKTLRQNIEARTCEIEENENLIDHNKNYDELTDWVTKLPQEMLKFGELIILYSLIQSDLRPNTLPIWLSIKYIVDYLSFPS